jgi:predicted dehydrogenase
LAGAGMVADHHCPAWLKLPQVELVGVFSRNLDKARSRADLYGIETAYNDYLHMLDEQKPDVVDIATAPEAHSAQVMAAADRCIDILCQKPMTPSLEESTRLVQQVGERVRFMVHENWRFRPQYRQIGEWLRQDRIGSVSEFKMTVRSSGLITRTAANNLFALERQPFFAKLERFIIMELLIHHLDTMRYLLGPLSVQGCATAQSCAEVIGEDIAQINLKSDSGAFGTVTGNFCAAGYPPLPLDDLEVIGNRGSVVFKKHKLELLGPDPEEIIYNREEAYQASYDNAIAHFVEALEGGTAFETDRLDNLKTFEMVEESYRLASQ